MEGQPLQMRLVETLLSSRSDHDTMGKGHWKVEHVTR
jgi:hypothetical protein